MSFVITSPANTSSFSTNTINKSKYLNTLHNLDLEIDEQKKKLSELIENLEKGIFIQLISAYPSIVPTLPEASTLPPGSFFLITAPSEIDNVSYLSGDLALAVPAENKYLKVDRQSLVVGTNLSVGNQSNVSLDVKSSTGNSATLNVADENHAGLFSSQDFLKLQSIEAFAQVDEDTDLGIELGESTAIITSSTGKSTTVPSASLTKAGLMSKEDKIKLNSIETGATKETNLGTEQNLLSVYITSDRGEDAEIEKATLTRAGVMTAEDKSDLTGLILTVNNITESKSQPFGLASLDANGKVPLSQIRVSDLNLQGQYNALTNTPDLVSSAPSGTVNGDFWIVVESGSQILYGNTEASDLQIGYNIVYQDVDDKFIVVKTETVGTNLAIGTNNLTSLEITSNTGSSVTINSASQVNAGLISAIDKSKLDGVEQGATKETNLSTNFTSLDVTVESSNGTDATLTASTSTNAGVMSANDKIKLDSIEEGANVNVPCNLGVVATSELVNVTSSSGDDTVINSATASFAGVLTATDKNKLDGVEANAQQNVPTNLDITTSTTTATVSSSTGNNIIIPAATINKAGLLTSSEKSKLDTVENNAQKNVATNLGVSTSSTTVSITSSTGNNATIPAASTSKAGVMVSADKTKLDGIESNAQKNVATNLGVSTSSTTVSITSSTGNNATIPAATTSKAGLLTSSDKTKLNGLANSSLPVGTILSYVGTSAPSGYLLCDGRSISSSYSQLRSLLGNNTPDLRGRYLGGYGSKGLSSLKTMYNQSTARPSTPFKSSSFIPNGATRGFSGAGSKNAYSDGASKVTIEEGGDSYTRPYTFTVNFIVKHD